MFRNDYLLFLGNLKPLLLGILQSLITILMNAVLNLQKMNVEVEKKGIIITKRCKMAD
ncbi:hypothetical protein BCQ_4438 [Bacillus cereus Q1]|uniref:Uncharacterized protein n=2 Tax=Bacillus cereus group TaxID=86661 RepID=B9J0D4_BACCQ|nr:hypothetical protein BCQ_4438 [Bacillus cereus Q1]